MSIAFNILLPVVILQQFSKRLGDQGPLWALIIAVSLPVAYGIWDYLTNHHKNYVSLLGVFSVLFTGGFALLKLSGFWFAVKEAAFPGLMAIGVAISAFTSRPLMRVLFFNDQVLNIARIEGRLIELGRQLAFDRLLKRSTLWLSGSFVFSAVLNFVLAQRIFVDLDPGTSQVHQAEILNQQIAKMTGYGFLAIALPMMIFMGIVLALFLRRLSQITQLQFDELIKS